MSTSPHVRVLRRIDTSDADVCWLWPGGLTRGGYGVTSGANRRTNDYVHRMVFEALVGPIPEGMHIDHRCHVEALLAGNCAPGKCDHRRCVNPAHLRIATPQENVTAAGLPASCANGHEFTPENTYRYRGHRQCQECRRTHRAAHKARQKEGDPDSLFGKSLQPAGGGSHA